ncbi:MAG: hypothetical protein RLY11_983 [Bacteroidota bacterium]|jgi:Outer membrane protein beta-barrel family/Carboxypeptidase regulatory-like domain
MKRGLYALFIILLTSFVANSQEGFQVNGRLVDTLGNPISRATVGVYIAGGKDTIKTLTNNVGFFLIKGIPQRKFVLMISSLGYGTNLKAYTIPNEEEVLKLEDIKLLPSYSSLQEIVVSVPPVIVKEDTVEYKADSFKLKPNAMVEDLLKKMPGIEVDKNGNITAQGKTVTKVRVNGKDFFSGDPKAATQQLSADMIDKVQVVDDYGDLANASGIKDGEPDKVINLQLKKDRNRGVFSRTTVGAGTNDRYAATANLNFFNNNKQVSVFGGANNNNSNTFDFNSSGGGGGFGGQGGGGGGRGFQVMIGGNNQGGIGGQEGLSTTNSMGVNFRNDLENKKGSVYGNYSYSSRKTEIERDIASQNFFQNTKFLNHQVVNSNSNVYTHRASLNFEWNIDSFNYVKFIPEFFARESNSTTASVFDYLKNDVDTTSRGKNNDFSKSFSPSFNGNLIFNHKFQKRGRNLSVNITGGYNTTDGESNKNNLTNNFLLNRIDSVILKQNVNTNNQSDNFSIRFNYTEPIMKGRFLDMIYSYSQSYVNNDRATYVVDALGNPVFSNLLSNAYETDFIRQRMGANIRTIRKKYNYTFGASTQPINQRGYSITKDSAYTPIKRLNLLPSANFAYNFTRNKTLRFFYNGNANQPSFSQLQPVKDVSNPQYQTQGNPLLKPELAHIFSLSFNNLNFLTGQTFFIGSNFNFTHNQIVNNTIRVGNNGSQLTTYDNVNGAYSASGFYNFSKPWKNRTYILSFNGTAAYNNSITLIDNVQNFGKTLLFAQGAKFEFNWKDWLEFDLGGRYGVNNTKYSLSGQPNVNYHSWTITNNSRVDIPGGWVFRHDLEYIINRGLSSSVNQNIALLNANFEKTLFKKKNGIFRISGFDILNQNKAIARTVNGNNIVDTRVNRLTRYFMMSFIYRFNKYKGQQPSSNMGGPGGSQMRDVRF